MGINRQVLHALLSENAYDPIRGSVLLIGRSTVTIRETTISAIAKKFGRSTPSWVTSAKSTKHSSEVFFIDDIELFRWLSPEIQDIDVLDVSEYEGANIVHDLNTPVGSSLEGKYDFVYDSSVLDNIFSPAAGISNIYRMMSKGGRYLGLNVSSFYPGAFAALPPEWFYAFFSVNKCSDLKVYLTVQREAGLDRFEYLTDLYRYKPTYTPSVDFNHFHAVTKSVGVCHSIVIAEKGSHSEAPSEVCAQEVLLPVNLQYLQSSRSIDWAKAELRYSASARPILSATGSKAYETSGQAFHDSDHYIFLGSGF